MDDNEEEEEEDSDSDSGVRTLLAYPKVASRLDG